MQVVPLLLSNPNVGRAALAGQTASSTVTLVAAGTNVNGLIVLSMWWKWYLGAVNSSVLVALTAGAGGAQGRFNNTFDDNGATGPVNIPMTALFTLPIQIPAGVALIADFSIAGTARLCGEACVRIL